MARTKITVYVTPDMADALKRLAAADDRSMSDIIEDAITRRLSDLGRDVEHAAVMSKFEQVLRRLGVIEKGVESHFELTAHTARFSMSVAPEIPRHSSSPSMHAAPNDSEAFLRRSPQD